jgi:hypothetical protein
MSTNSRKNPSRVTNPLSSKLDGLSHSYTCKLPADPQIVTRKLFNESGDLVPAFETVDIPWIEHGYKTRFNLEYQQLGREHRYITRTRRKSSLICKLSDILKLVYLTRNRRISHVRARLALLEISHRRRCAGNVGSFSIREFRALVGTTRITDAQVLALLHNPKIPVSEDALYQMAQVLGQDRLERPVWIPRRLIRHLAAHGSRLEIATALALAARRMVNRFGRARLSARMVADLTGASQKHVRTALQSLASKRLIIKNRQAERWSVNRWGSLYDFPEDLSIDPFNEQKPLRDPPKRRRSVGFSPRSHGAVLMLLMQKGANLINKDPSSLLEQQESLGQPLQMAPPNPEFRAERPRLGLLAGNFRFEREQPEAPDPFAYDRIRSQYPPHVPKQAPWRKAA